MSEIREFRQFIERRKPTHITFASVDQKRYGEDPCALQLNFSKILVNEFPAVICLSGECGTVRFNRVKNIEVAENKNSVGMVITIYCSTAGSTTENSYVLFAM